MDKDLLIENIQKYAARKKESPSHACIAAGCGKSFISDIRRGQTPTVGKLIDLATYLGCSVSDLVGDAPLRIEKRGYIIPPTPRSEIQAAFDQLNEEGRARLLEQADDMIRSGKYIKSPADKIG